MLVVPLISWSHIVSWGKSYRSTLLAAFCIVIRENPLQSARLHHWRVTWGISERQTSWTNHSYYCFQLFIQMSLTSKDNSRELYHISEVNCCDPISCMSLWSWCAKVSHSCTLLGFISDLCKWWLYSNICTITVVVHIDLSQLPSNTRPKSGMLQSVVWAASQMRLRVRQRNGEKEVKRLRAWVQWGRNREGVGRCVMGGCKRGR